MPYTRITSTEFEDFLSSLVPDAKRVQVADVTEDVWDLPLPVPELSIRIFSTIQDGGARDRGADAIRCVLWSHEADQPVGGRTKTLRIETWRKNLRAKIRDLYANWRDHDHGRCPDCGTGVLLERHPKPSDDWTAFLACSRWNGGDGCNYTETL